MEERQEASYTPSMTGRKPRKELKRGWTTGACAAAGAKAAFCALLSGEWASSVQIRLPKGETPTFALKQRDLSDGTATASVIKDAGDDPDVTHGAEIVVTLGRGESGTGITFEAGAGVGTVTLVGLPLAVGEPAINPGPRAIITENLQDAAATFGAPCDVVVRVSVPGGEAIAQKTMNPRLGIIGGISILGTTGVVIPYSCASWIHSIHRGIDVARALGLRHAIAATGSTSEKAARAAYPDLPEQALLDMGDFAGGLLKYLRKHPLEKLTMAGGFAKMTKLAQGALDLHSSRSAVDFERLSKWCGDVGGSRALCDKIANANTAMQARELASAAGVDLAPLIARRARETAMASLSGDTDVAVRLYDRQGNELARTDD